MSEVFGVVWWVVKGRGRRTLPISGYIAASDTNLDVTGSEIAFPRRRAKINSKIILSLAGQPSGILNEATLDRRERSAEPL